MFFSNHPIRNRSPYQWRHCFRSQGFRHKHGDDEQRISNAKKPGITKIDPSFSTEDAWSQGLRSCMGNTFIGISPKSTKRLYAGPRAGNAIHFLAAILQVGVSIFAQPGVVKTLRVLNLSMTSQGNHGGSIMVRTHGRATRRRRKKDSDHLHRIS